MRPRTQVFVLYWLPPLAWAAAIFVQSSFRFPIPPKTGFELSDKVLHVIAYAGLGWLLFHAFLRGRGMAVGRAAWWAFVAAALYGASDEIHQGLVPSRTMEWGDWFADVAGAATVFLAVPMAAFLQRFRGTSGTPSG